MAVVYVGINVFFSMALSAVISLVVLITVQLNKMIKEKVGKLASRDIVTPIDNAAHKGEDEHNGKPAEEVVTKGEKRVKWADIRKRRPSNAGNANLPLTGTSTTSLPADPAPQTPVYLESTSAKTPSPFTWETSKGKVRNRQSRAKSASRVVPVTTASPANTGVDRDPNQWAAISPWSVEDRRADYREGSKTSLNDGVVTPSSCHVDVPFPTDQAQPNPKTSAFATDMKAYDIW
ncbi:hypothetical protein EGW08_014844 [Elysia chlorotica]|uniref:Uncharacterized protein n=1 Tax=Elysia chlorotica TaxID=188477 RepID=A0A433T796_ELYCH|nr:hypothetical protein EGW08_014844 [Elysia chlorotica]